ncbi:hypothetical protein JHK87_015227 [Glycine soja]|nr:hypothetical protein JHK87_015227 [Glycine soja]
MDEHDDMLVFQLQLCLACQGHGLKIIASHLIPIQLKLEDSLYTTNSSLFVKLAFKISLHLIRRLAPSHKRQFATLRRMCRPPLPCGAGLHPPFLTTALSSFSVASHPIVELLGAFSDFRTLLTWTPLGKNNPHRLVNFQLPPCRTMTTTEATWISNNSVRHSLKLGPWLPTLSARNREKNARTSSLRLLQIQKQQPWFKMMCLEEQSSGDLSSVCSSYSSLSIKGNGSDVDNADPSQAEETLEKEQYEYDKALNADRTYLKFKKRLDAYPEQCYRYSYGGRPILAAADKMNPGSCDLCGRPRQFEMQLMLPLLYFLQEALGDQRKIVGKWDWMTLIIYTCSESCCEGIEQAKSNTKSWIVAEEAVVAQCEEPMAVQLGVGEVIS